MLRKKFNFGIIFLAILFSVQSFADKSVPVFTGKLWILHPKNVDVRFEDDVKDGMPSGKITVPSAATKFSVYSNIPMKENRNYKISFKYLIGEARTDEKTKWQIILNFNKQGGKNGSAGRIGFSLEMDKARGWQTFSSEIEAPPGAAMCQFIILELSGLKGSFWINSVKFEEVKNVFKVNKSISMPPPDGNLEHGWEKAVRIDDFYNPRNSAMPSKKAVSAFITYDDKNLYIAFRNSEPEMERIKNRIKERDGALWLDDCNEVFISAPDGKAYQFILNSGNVQWDGKLYAKMPGDPYRADDKWNGEWESAVCKGKDFWTGVFRIPFANFNVEPKAGSLWGINLGRERKVFPEELSQLNRHDNAFNNVEKFAQLEFQNDSAVLSRYSEKVIKDPFIVKRKSPKYEELLSSVPGNYLVAVNKAPSDLNFYPQKLKDKYTPASFAQELDNIYSECGKSGTLTHLPDDIMETKRLNGKYGVFFWKNLTIPSSVKKAVSNSSDFVSGNKVDVNDPLYQKGSLEHVHEYCEKSKNRFQYLKFILGVDEPLNDTFQIYSLSANKKHREALLKLDESIRKNFGFGKYGLYDDFIEKNINSPFEMISFMRWWNSAFAENLKKRKDLLKSSVPDTPSIAWNMGYVRGMSREDVSLLAQHSDYVSVDPYPTAALYGFSQPRSLYHTGFSVKFAKDLSGGKKLHCYTQNFSYCTRTPSVSNLREWASQALKNDSDCITWWCGSLTWGHVHVRIAVPENYREMIRLNNIISHVNRLKTPTETKTGIFFSCPSFWGTFDKAVHSYYTVYSLLGENIKTWFRFVSDSELRLKMDDISRYKAVYVPQLKYCEADTAELLLNYVRNGGRLVIFDPEAFAWNIDGTHLDKIRSELIGCQAGKAIDVKNMIASVDYSGLKKGDELPLTPLMHRADAGKIQAFEITPPAGAKIIATYPDGRPAAFERSVGNGSVIYFAAQPFGNSDLAVRDSKWSAFMRGIAEQVGEKLDLPIWDFELPAKGGEIEVKYVIKPDAN